MARLVAVVGPSGAGKDTLMLRALAACPDLRLARRVITRAPDAGGEDCDCVTEAEFDRRLQAGEFALHWQAHGLHYAIPASQLEGEGVVLFNASRGVLADAVARWPGTGVILVTAPPDVLARRLALRGRETADDQARRLKRADFALPPGVVPRIVMNDTTPDEALGRFLAALQPESA